MEETNEQKKARYTSQYIQQLKDSNNSIWKKLGLLAAEILPKSEEAELLLSLLAQCIDDRDELYKELQETITGKCELYEIRNTTSDEVYHSLGFAHTLEDAKAMIHECDSYPASLDDIYDGYLVISIYKRKIGWSDGGWEKCVWEIAYEEMENDDENGDDYEMKITYEGEHRR